MFNKAKDSTNNALQLARKQVRHPNVHIQLFGARIRQIDSKARSGSAKSAGSLAPMLTKRKTYQRHQTGYCTIGGTKCVPCKKLKLAIGTTTCPCTRLAVAVLSIISALTRLAVLSVLSHSSQFRRGTKHLSGSQVNEYVLNQNRSCDRHQCLASAASHNLVRLAEAPQDRLAGAC